MLIVVPLLNKDSIFLANKYRWLPKLFQQHFYNFIHSISIRYMLSNLQFLYSCSRTHTLYNSYFELLLLKSTAPFHPHIGQSFSTVLKLFHQILQTFFQTLNLTICLIQSGRNQSSFLPPPPTVARK